MTPNKLKHQYWALREQLPAWFAAHRPAEIVRQLRLRIDAWKTPVVELQGVRIARSPAYTVAILETLARGDYERPEARIMARALSPEDTVMELGTGLGYLSCLCAKTTGSARVHTFEANPALEAVIRKNYALNGVSPRLDICLLGAAPGTVTFYLMKNFWSSSTVKRHPRARAIRVPVKSFNDTLAAIRPSFLLVDIEGGEEDLFSFARLDGVRKLCIELHPHVIGQAAVDKVVAAIEQQGFREDASVSDDQHKLFVRD